MRFILILLSIVNTNGYCPRNFSQNILDNGCILNIDNPPPYIGHGIINISWNPILFRENIYLRLLSRDPIINYNNCYYSYRNVMLDDGTLLVSETIENTGYYTWHINNVNYENIEYYLQISENNNLRCINGIINQNYATTHGFRLQSNIDSNFRWIWPQNPNNNLVVNLGETYNIEVSGFYHRDRAAYGFQLAASISNFESSVVFTLKSPRATEG